MDIIMIAYYVIERIENPKEVIKRHKSFLQGIDSKGRIYIGKQGVNAQLSVARVDLKKYLDFLKSDPLYYSADIKLHEDSVHRFAKLTVKERDQIVALDQEVNFTYRGEYISPEDWNKKLDERDENTIIIDVRNNYESDVGYFEGALKPDKRTFREFIEYADKLADVTENKDDKTVLMYCTGGIRCEFYSPLMKERGFKNVFQLKGGVIAYGLDQGKKHWRGKLFVFDDRLVVPICEDNTEIISKCKFCHGPSDIFYNCANMDCNDLFLSCKKCAKEHKGCCCQACMTDGRVREMDSSNERPTPFRKIPFDQKQRISCKL
jgi:UPF0176 protein